MSNEKSRPEPPYQGPTMNGLWVAMQNRIKELEAERDEARDALKTISELRGWAMHDRANLLIAVETAKDALQKGAPKESAPESPRYDSTTAKRVRAREGEGNE